MANEGRRRRVAELVREEVAMMIQKGLKDPRIGFVSVTAARMSPDLKYANVYVSLFGDEQDKKSSLIGLRNSAGWVRRELGKKLRLRYTPQVRFFEDASLDDVFHLEEVFKQIHEDEHRAETDNEEVDRHDDVD